ncbi:hypothetical protein BHM03_00053493, partial [Ensete ventricosum]
DRPMVDGAESLCAAGHVVTLVLRASWFNLSSCSRAKEMAALSVPFLKLYKGDRLEGIREIGRLKDWWTEGFDFWVRFVVVLGANWGCGFVEFRLRIGVVLGL